MERGRRYKALQIAYLIKIILIWLTCPAILFAGNEWELVEKEDGVAVYARELRGHSGREFKGVCLVKQPIEVIGSVLSDIPSYPKWFFKCIESRRISSENTSGLNLFLYIAIDTPWPFSDRDVVYKTEVTIDRALGKVAIRSTALKEQFVPLRSGYVRITDSEHRWILESVSSARTRITFINRTNAAGPFANYISDPGTRDTTVRSLKNLIKIAKDPKYAKAALFRQRNQQNRAGSLFENGHSDIIDPTETHFFRKLVAAQNDKVCVYIPRHFTDCQSRIRRQTCK